jgi:hypothetical protein
MEKPHSPIVAVLVNFHSGEDTLACIHSIRTQESQAVFFVVVDNSQPGDARLDGIDVEFSNLVLLRNTANIGFGRANNQGIAWAQANLRFDYLILINNDTLIEKDAFSALTHVFSEHTSTGISTGKILYADHPDLVWYGGAKINRKKGWPEIADFNQKATEEGANCAREVEFISGCLMCFSAQSIEDLKGFDPDFFMYCEDLEWSLRVAKSAYGMRYTPEAVIYHKVHGSGLHKGETPKNLDVRNPNVAFLFFHLKTNQYRAIRRHFGLREFLRFLLYFWGRYAWFELKMLLHGKFAFLGTSMKTRWAILKIVFTEKRHR